jgi:hypothetical protein
MAHLTLRRLQELGVAGCERMIERFACSVRGLSPPAAPSCSRCFYLSVECAINRIGQSRVCGLDGRQAAAIIATTMYGCEIV